MYDALTGALNRRGFEHELSREQERARRTGEPLCVVMIDCDNFKGVNDSLGHAAGDVVLKTVATRLREGLRPTDPLGRIGGDEFLALLPGAGMGQALHVAERLRLSVCDSPVALSHEDVRLSVSVALAPIESGALTIEELLALCRRPLHDSKRYGKNRTSLAPSHESGAFAPVSDSLVDVLAMNRAFSVVAQSIVRLNTGAVCGVELLSRGPQGRYHMPSDLFQSAVEENLLVPVDVCCLRACLGVVGQMKADHPCHVNVYPATLLELNVQGVANLLVSAGLAPRVVFELSERQTLGDLDALRGVARELRELGFRLALDDVGFGRSSLESLILLEPEVVKIDRRHVCGVSEDRERRRALQRIVRTVSALDSDIVAEGVEYESDLDVLRDLGVEYGQGYFFDKPGPLDGWIPLHPPRAEA